MTSSQARVLIVDDNAETVSVLRDILSREGYQISSAGDPKAAHSYLEKFSADMILTDLHLPQVDGLTFLSQVREHSKDIPVVLMTAYGSLRTAVEGLKAGAFDYLSKPFMDDEVRLVVRRALEQKQCLAGPNAFRSSAAAPRIREFDRQQSCNGECVQGGRSRRASGHHSPPTR